MSHPPLRLDPRQSLLRVLTYATGPLAALAHDLEIHATDWSAELVSSSVPEARVRVTVAGLRVQGALKHGTLTQLKPADCREIEGRIHKEVMRQGRTVEVRAVLQGTRVTLELQVPTGNARLETTAAITTLASGAQQAEGRVALSLRQLGIAEVRGPLGVIKVKDGVDVHFRAVFVPIPAPVTT